MQAYYVSCLLMQISKPSTKQFSNSSILFTSLIVICISLAVLGSKMYMYTINNTKTKYNPLITKAINIYLYVFACNIQRKKHQIKVLYRVFFRNIRQFLPTFTLYLINNNKLRKPSSPQQALRVRRLYWIYSSYHVIIGNRRSTQLFIISTVS